MKVWILDYPIDVLEFTKLIQNISYNWIYLTINFSSILNRNDKNDPRYLMISFKYQISKDLSGVFSLPKDGSVVATQ